MTNDGTSRPAWTTHGAAIVNGGRIHYRRIGKGPETVVLLHGFPQTGRSWDRVAALLADRFTVIAPDLRGAGESHRPATGYDKKTMATDIHALMASLRLDRARPRYRKLRALYSGRAAGAARS